MPKSSSKRNSKGDKPKVRKTAQKKSVQDVCMEESAADVTMSLNIPAHSKNDGLRKKSPKNLSKRAQLHMAVLRQREERAAKLAAEEADLPESEQLKRLQRRAELEEFRELKKKIASLKQQRSRLGKKSLPARDQRKVINKEIRALEEKILRPQKSAAPGAEALVNEKMDD